MTSINLKPTTSAAVSTVNFKSEIKGFNDFNNLLAPSDKPDTVEVSTIPAAEISGANQAPNISRWRLFFNRLTNDQIDAVNKSGRLPKKAKFTPFIGGYSIANNWWNITAGTTKLPAGFEVRKSIFGFTRVVPIDTKGLFLKNKPEL